MSSYMKGLRMQTWKLSFCLAIFICYIWVICSGVTEAVEQWAMATMWVSILVLLLGTATKDTQKQWKSQMIQQGPSAKLKEPQGVLTKCEIKPGRGSGELVACQWEQIYLKHNTCRASEWGKQCLSRLLISLIVDRTSAPTDFKTAGHLHLQAKDKEGSVCASERQMISRKLNTTERNADRIMDSPRAKSPPPDLHSFAVFQKLDMYWGDTAECFLALGNQLQQDECLITAQQLSTSSCGNPRWATLNFMPSATEFDFGRFSSLV